MKKLVYKYEPYIKIFKVNKKFNNQILKDYHDIKLCDGTMVILKKRNKILFLKEYRFAFNKKTFGLPGGIVETKQNSVLNTVKRELLEETGFVAKNWKNLLNFKRHGTYDCGQDFVFTADYKYQKQNKSLEDKNNTLHWIKIDTLEKFIEKNASLLTPGVIASIFFYISKVKKN